LAGDYYGAPGQVNAVAATSDWFRVSGVVILPGIEAPSAARSPLIMRPYDQELLTCQSYWRKITNVYLYGYGAAGTAFGGAWTYTPMRSAPAGAVTGTFSYTNSSGLAVWSAAPDNVVLRAGVTAAGNTSITPNPDGAVTLDARL